MSKYAWVVVGLSLLLITGSVGLKVVERTVFPVWGPNYFDQNPATLGPYEVRVDLVANKLEIDGRKFDVSLFYPEDPEIAMPVFIWLMGSNIQVYYHQSLHEALASYGYLVIVPDTPSFSFTDLTYHRDLLALADEALNMALDGSLGPEVDGKRIAAGGYSIGASLAAFLAGRRSEINGLVFWAPSGTPYWLGIDGSSLYSRVDVPSLYVLGEKDDGAPPEGGYPEKMQELTPGSPARVEVIENGNHHYFQQPTEADRFSVKTSITRYEQQRKAINITREWLNQLFGLD
jgi:dienelactone hydrolase